MVSASMKKGLLLLALLIAAITAVVGYSALTRSKGKDYQGTLIKTTSQNSEFKLQIVNNKTIERIVADPDFGEISKITINLTPEEQKWYKYRSGGGDQETTYSSYGFATEGSTLVISIHFDPEYLDRASSSFEKSRTKTLGDWREPSFYFLAAVGHFKLINSQSPGDQSYKEVIQTARESAYNLYKPVISLSKK